RDFTPRGVGKKLQKAPGNATAGAQRHQHVVMERQLLWHLPCLLDQRDTVLIDRQAIELGAKYAREVFELVERAGRGEYLGIQLDAGMRGINARAAARGLFRAARMRRAVGTKKKFRVAAGCRDNQRATVFLALQQRQAKMMRPD